MPGIDSLIDGVCGLFRTYMPGVLDAITQTEGLEVGSLPHPKSVIKLEHGNLGGDDTPVIMVDYLSGRMVENLGVQEYEPVVAAGPVIVTPGREVVVQRWEEDLHIVVAVQSGQAQRASMIRNDRTDWLESAELQRHYMDAVRTVLAQWPSPGAAARLIPGTITDRPTGQRKATGNAKVARESELTVSYSRLVESPLPVYGVVLSTHINVYPFMPPA